MNKIELLSPAGNKECLYAAIMAGCDAVYLGGKNFGARAFASNFNNDELIEAINLCHSYGVKIYITINTLIYENEVDSFIEYVDFLHKNNVDAVIMQDLGMLDLVRQMFPNLEVHASTQMHIHNQDGVELMKKLGVKRVVLARETNIDLIKKIKKEVDMNIEIFVHGALCISYSGQCLMSSLIGGRSGNRGACAGACRLPYDVIDLDGNKLNKDDYPLSTKDLNSLERIGELIEAGVDSFKIEGRMKSPEYVFLVTSLYRKAIDSFVKTGKIEIDYEDLYSLKKTFNREFTKGFLFNEENNELVNPKRPNHQGVKLGTVIKYKKKFATILLENDFNIGAGLRIVNEKKDDVGVKVNEMFVDYKLVKFAKRGERVSLKVNASVEEGAQVLITSDEIIKKKIDEFIKNNPRRIPIVINIKARAGSNLIISVSDSNNEVTLTGNVVETAQNNPTTEDILREKASKLNNTIYKLEKISFEIDHDIFIPMAEFNNLRRQAVNILNEKRLYKSNYERRKYQRNVPNFKKEKLLTILVENKTVYDKIDKNNYDMVYCEENIPCTILKLPRVIEKYPLIDDRVLVGEVGAFNTLKSVDTDFSFNVVNSYTVAFLHSLGALKVTLSHEMTDDQIQDLIESYQIRYNAHPNLEIIVSSNEEVMISKFSLNKYYDKDKLYLKDRFQNRYLVKTKNDLMYIYNYKSNRSYDEKYYNMGINSQRINII